MPSLEDLVKRSVLLKRFPDAVPVEAIKQFISDRTGGFPVDVCSLNHLTWPDGEIRWLALLRSESDQQSILQQPTLVINHRGKDYSVSADIPSVCIIPQHWTDTNPQMDDNMDYTSDKDTTAGMPEKQNDSSAPELPSDGAISGMGDLQNMQIGTTSDQVSNRSQEQTSTGQELGTPRLPGPGQGSEHPSHSGMPPTGYGQGQPYFQGGYNTHSGGQAYPYPLLDQSGSGQTSEQLPQGGQQEQGPPCHPPEYTYSDQQVQHNMYPGQMPVPQPYYDQRYNCMVQFHPPSGQWVRVPVYPNHPQDPSFQQQHGPLNYSKSDQHHDSVSQQQGVQGRSGLGSPRRSSQDHPDQRQQFPGQNRPPSQVYPGQPIQGSEHQHQDSHFLNMPTDPPPPYRESVKMPDPIQLTCVKDQYEMEKKFPIVDAVSAPSADASPGKPSTVRSEERDSDRREVGEESDGFQTPEGDVPLCTIEVRGLPVGVTKDTVTLYFENTRRSGGGAVKKIDLREDGTALVHFEDNVAVDRVLGKGPHTIANMEVEVSRYRPDTPKTTTLKKEEGLDEVTKTVIVRGAGKISKETLSLYFENKRKSGGGTVEELKDGDAGEVIVTFEEAEVAQRVLENVQHVVEKQKLELYAYTQNKPEALMEEEAGPANTITVRGFGELLDNTLLMYFENKRSGGGDVEEMRRGSDPDVIYITFENPEVVQQVLEKAPHTLENQEMDVSLFKPEKPEPVVEEDTGPPDTIVVRGFGELLDDTLSMYFENKRSGGGEVKEMRRGSNPDVIYITFENPEVVQQVLEKAPHTLESQEMDVSLFKPKKPKPVIEEDTGPPDTIVVRGFGTASDDTLSMYFESKRSGGGEVKEVRRGSDPDVVYITFENPEDVESVCTRAHTLQGNSLQVALYVPSPPSSSQQRPTQYGMDENISSDEKEDDDSVYVLEVKGITDTMSEDTINLYFENRRRSGGGEVELLEFDKDTGSVLVYFKEGNVVQRVLQKAPHLLDKKKLEVSEYRYSPSRSRGQGSQDSPLKGTKEGTVVEIRGFKEGSSDDTLLLYFENKRRSGGANVQELITVDSDEGERIKYVVYETKEEAENVASREHKVDGQVLQVRLYRSPTPPPLKPKYPDRFLISGLKETTSKKALTNFMQDKLECDPKDLVYGEEPGTVLVTVSDKRILSKLKKMKRICRKRPLEGAFLEIAAVPISNCILVKGLGEKTSEDTLLLYFENKKSGNSKGVEKVEMVEDSDHALVFFEDHEEIPKVLIKTHKLDGRTLQVILYTECLGPGGGHRDPSWFSVPPPITLDNLDPYKLRFIKESKSNLKNLEEQLAGGFSVLKWASEESVILECALTKTTEGARNKVKEWKKEAQDDFHHFLDLLISEKVNVLQEVWNDVLGKIVAVKMPRPDAAAIFVFDESHLIVVAGHQRVAENLIKQVKETVSTVENDHERKKKEITEIVNNLRPWQLRLLAAIGFPGDMMKKYPTLRVDINTRKYEITFVGLMFDVKNVKIDMYESITSMKDTSLTNLSDAQIKLLQKKDVRLYIVKKLKQKNLAGVWEADNDKLKIYGRSDTEVTDVAHVLKQSLCEQVIDLDMESVPLLSSPKWMTMYDEQTKTHGDTVKIMPAADKSRVVIVATDELIAGVSEAVNNFIRDNTVYSDTVRFPKGVQRFMIQHMDGEIKELGRKFQGYSAEIVFQKASLEFTVKGTKDGLSIITSELVKISQGVLNLNHLFNKPGIAKLIRSEKGDQHISSIERFERCMIEKHYDDQEQVVYGNKRQQRAMRTVTGGPTALATCDLGSGHTLYVSQGDITQMRVDAIVNAANQQLAHIGGLARAIVDRGGNTIQAESDKITRSRGDIDVGDVAVTGPGQLLCKIVIHAVGPIWAGGKRDEEGLLQEAVFRSLEKADSYNVSSIAIPALSTGIYRYPVAEATEVIVEAVQIYFQKNPGSQVQDVYVCDNNVNTVQAFVSAVNKRFGKSNVRSQRTGNRDQSYTTDDEGSRAGHRSHNRGHRRFGNKPHGEAVQGGRGRNSTINIQIVTSEIAKEKVDVIVNTTSHGLDLTNGAVSKSLLKAGGRRIQQECSNKYPNGIKSGEFAITTGGNLLCQYIFHTCLPNWSHGPNQEQILETLVKECLESADQFGCTSIAFPALGTGNLGYPKDIVAKTMFAAVEQFSRSNPRSLVQEVKIVLYHGDPNTIKAFQDREGKTAGGGGPTGSRRERRFDPDYDSSSDHRETGWEHVSTSDLNDVIKIGSITLTIKQGDLTREKATCIVNSTNTEFDLRKGAVSQTLMKAGGDDLMSEVALKKHDMRNNGIAITTAKGLSAKYIVHVSSDYFNHDWKKVITKCLKEAGKTIKASSIAFPALGTGVLNSTTPEGMAKILIDALDDYQKSKSSHDLISDVRMVIFQKDMLTPFITAINKTLSGGKGNRNMIQRVQDWWKGDDTQRDGEKNRQKHQQEEVETEVTLHFFSDSQIHIQQAIDRLNQQFKESMMVKVMEDDILKHLSRRMKDEIEDLKHLHGVHLDYNHRIGRVRLQGLTSDVVQATDAVHKIILNAQRQVQESEHAEMLSSYVQWSYTVVDSKGNEKHIEYDKISNHTIEAAYKGGKPTVRITANDNVTYIIDFAKMEEYPSTDITDTVTVLRKDLIKGATFEEPSNWSTMNSDSELIPVQAGSPEYNKIQQQFLASLGRQGNIVKIERVQTKYLWTQYVAKKQQLDRQNPGNQNERTLWHGTSADAIPSIYKGGFNRSYCGKNATALGMGVYFAVSTAYSAQNTYSVPNSQGHKSMFMARVLVGMFTRGQGGMRVPPVRDASNHILFDSVVDNPAAPGMYIIFNDTQAYPEYLITFI